MSASSSTDARWPESSDVLPASLGPTMATSGPTGSLSSASYASSSSRTDERPLKTSSEALSTALGDAADTEWCFVHGMSAPFDDPAVREALKHVPVVITVWPNSPFPVWASEADELKSGERPVLGSGPGGDALRSEEQCDRRAVALRELALVHRYGPKTLGDRVPAPTAKRGGLNMAARAGGAENQHQRSREA